MFFFILDMLWIAIEYKIPIPPFSPFVYRRFRMIFQIQGLSGLPVPGRDLIAMDMEVFSDIARSRSIAWLMENILNYFQSVFIKNPRVF